jgi:uncharacterized protein
MNSKYFIFLCIYLFSFIHVNAASFDCSKATTAQEKTICNTPSLSSLDEKLAKIYKESMANALDPEALKSEQRAWLKETRSCNADPACLGRSYETRISLLLPKKSDVQHQSQPEPQPAILPSSDSSTSTTPKSVASDPNNSETVTNTSPSANVVATPQNNSTQSTKELASNAWDSIYFKYGVIAFGLMVVFAVLFWAVKKAIKGLKKGLEVVGEKSNQLKKEIKESAIKAGESASVTSAKFQESLVEAKERSAPHLQSLKNDISDIKNKANSGISAKEKTISERFSHFFSLLTSRQKIILSSSILILLGSFFLVKISSDMGELKNKYPMEKPLFYIKNDNVTKNDCDLYGRTMGYEDQICINNKKHWKSLCENAVMASETALLKPAHVAKGFGKSKNSPAALVMVGKNNGASLKSTEWVEDGKYGKCMMSVLYSGLYEGTKINEVLSAEVWVMAVVDEGAYIAR